MNARQHLEALAYCVTHHHADCDERPKLVHDVNNFLAVPELAPAQFQQEICKRLVARAAAQGLNVTQAKDVKLTRSYLDMMAGAGHTLEILGSDQLNPLLVLMSFLAARGPEVVHKIAEGKPL